MSVLKKYKMLIFFIITCVLLEMFIANISAIRMVISGGECMEMPLDSQSIGSYKGNISFYDGKISVSGGDITFNDINSEMHNVSLTVNGSGIYVPITVSFTDDNFAYEKGFDYNSNDINLYAYNDTENYIMLSSYGNVKSLRISFDKLDTPVEITDISINKIPSFRFNFLRFGIIILIALVIKYKLWNVKLSDRHPPLLFMVTVVLCGCIMCSAVVIANSASDVSLLQDYPISNINAQDQYIQLFDAFQKGQLNLDLDYDTSNFDRAENIYDRSERKHEGISGSFWDRAYYNGKFYSYFGAAPVI
ncbi:MAG: hypothetical protein K2M82_05930, partial [Lachnospiraceae bacterium]|nr:hypothetical protein [Lachnospiraceae bacterium]